jgi:hypothetical protein
MKHPWAEATRILEKGGQRYGLCIDCSWNALTAGERLLCPENGGYVHLDANEKPIFTPRSPAIAR